jgi:flagellar hook-associated protein 3 FlgL
MRIADKMAYDQIKGNIARNRSEMSELQNQAATQKRVTKPSDDPVAASRVLFSKTEQRSADQFIKNLNYARSFLDFSEQSLGEVSELLIRAKELAIAQASDAGASEQTRKVVAAEVSQLYDQSVQIANRKLGERFIFGGFKTTQPPFDLDGQYKGDGGELKLHIDKDSFLAMNIPGNAVFQGVGLTKDGGSFKTTKQATTVNEFLDQKQEVEFEQNPAAEVQARGPASLRNPNVASSEAPLADGEQAGANIFDTLRKLQTSLMANDKEGVQESLDRIDETLNQVVLARTQLGSRVMTIDNSLNSLHASNVDLKTTISQNEDVDAFEVISNMNKTEDTLKATLATSGKLVEKSLMDFIS